MPCLIQRVFQHGNAVLLGPVVQKTMEGVMNASIALRVWLLLEYGYCRPAVHCTALRPRPRLRLPRKVVAY